jgi:hypothetical protein
MKILRTTFVLIISTLSLCASEPSSALKNYFNAIDQLDKELLKSSVHAPEVFKDNFAGIIDVAENLGALETLLAEKYEVPEDDRKSLMNFTSQLSKDISEREFKVTENTAVSVPLSENEAPVKLINIDGAWKLDLQHGLPDEMLNQQSVMMKKACDAVVIVLQNLIGKIDTLDTSKYTYDDAISMVNIQMQRKLEAALNQP